MDKINSQNIQHVAIIMDGNGRWAEKKELHRSEGHKKGLDNILPIVEELIIGISLVSIFMIMI